MGLTFGIDALCLEPMQRVQDDETCPAGVCRDEFLGRLGRPGVSEAGDLVYFPYFAGGVREVAVCVSAR
jgi:hypothetical protein